MNCLCKTWQEKTLNKLHLFQTMDDEDDCVKSAGGTDSNYDEDAELKQMGSDADDSDDSS